jgi:hypothetical protein
MHFDKNKLTAIVHLDSKMVIDQIPPAIYARAEEFGMILKNEFHLTLIGNALGQKLKAASPTEVQIRTLEEELMIICQSDHVNFMESFYFCEKDYDQIFGQEIIKVDHTRQSIVQLTVTSMEKRVLQFLRQYFFVNLNDNLGHITLFTSATDKRAESLGIGMQDADEFRLYMKEAIEV